MRARRGFTLLELLVAVTILALVSLLIYGAFSGLRSTRDGVGQVSGRYHEGRSAMQRIARELQGSFLSFNRPIDASLMVRQTAFIGHRGSPADRVDFTSFAHRRLDRDSHESDQCELSYFGSPDPKQRGVTDLVRRVSPYIDLEPDRGGRVQVLATDIDLFQLEYLDPYTGRWQEQWDTTQALGQKDRLPLQVRVTLVLNGGRRAARGRAKGAITFDTKVKIPIQTPMDFAGVGALVQ
ncbi:MAG: prepilin-type N-terminal cleavage/methylation domain-containing protein [Polyangiaceae bacterium]|nr:prepilin-type N-terminal cleavage/methylation domain-containing protein [Polyangiaceae bacterium]MCW5791917.1 prepilin-type N-terminal cleavage/methylation domain-containing protein [Polyangiaceae bacterium]